MPVAGPVGSRILWAGWSLYLLAMFPPVVRELAQGGLQTALMSLAAIPMLVDFKRHDFYDVLLALSGIANLIMILSPVVLLRPRLAILFAWALPAASTIAVAWMPSVPNLSWGYYLWVAGFVTATLGMLMTRTPVHAPMAAAAAF